MTFLTIWKVIVIIRRCHEIPHGFNQNRLNNLTRDFNLSKEDSELLSTRLNNKNLLEEQERRLHFTVPYKKGLLPFYSQEGNLVMKLENP